MFQDNILVVRFLALPAMSGVVYNDILSVISLLGCNLMFLEALFGQRLRMLKELGAWSAALLVFGSVFQVCILVTGLAPEKIGFMMPMTPGLASGLFMTSILLFLTGWWIRMYRTTIK